MARGLRKIKIRQSVKGFVKRKLVHPFEEFIAQEASSGILLVIATAAALIWANLSPTYERVWHAPIGLDWLHRHPGATLHFVVNDMLMAVFFFVVGMAIKREVLVGELAERQQAVLPVVAAAGGAIVPALVYALFNSGGAGSGGWGVPMATDIAFAVGVMAILGKRVPLGIRVFLTALAIADDLMAVLVIAIFYTSQLAWIPLAGALACLLVLMGLNRAGVRRASAYAVAGIFLWEFTLRSGVHSTVAGVLLAFAIPARRENDLLYRLEHYLHPWVSFLIMPLFALANAGLVLSGSLLEKMGSPVVLGVWCGLLLGKPLGITTASWLAVQMKWARLPGRVSWRELHAASWLGGIGFTMSLFIASLAFGDADNLQPAKLGVFGASLTAALAGSALLLANKRNEGEEVEARPASIARGQG